MRKLFTRIWDVLSPRLIIAPDKWLNGTGNPYIYYREKDRVAAVVGEWVFGDKDCDFIIYTDFLVVWMQPHDTEFIEAEKKEEIILHIRTYVEKVLRVKKYQIVHDASYEQLVREMLGRGERLISFKDYG